MNPNSFKSVEGKVAIVTGAASGIGKAIAEVFAANGMKVVVSDIQDERGEKIVEEIRSNGGEAIYCHTDVTDEESIAKTVEAAKATFGKLHVMVNNAGIGGAMHPVHEYKTSDFKFINDVNFYGTFYGMKHAIQAMIDTDSHECSVINISSAEGIHPSENFSAYTTSKAAVAMLTRTTGLDYAKHDITVNCICPGVIWTDIYTKLPERQVEISKGMVPIGRFGKSEEIAYAALFLASNMARFITGAVIPVDAGLSAGNCIDMEWENPDPRKFD